MIKIEAGLAFEVKKPLTHSQTYFFIDENLATQENDVIFIITNKK
jgi:hypothetical protein